MTEKERKEFEESKKAYIDKETEFRRNIDVEKYFSECLNGEEAYHAVYLLLKHWADTTGDDDLRIIMAGMDTYWDKKQEWALAVARVVENREPGMRNYLEGSNTGISIERSCNCIKKE